VEHNRLSLDHRDYEKVDIFEVARGLDETCQLLDQKHRMQRKVQFLLDIRGYFIVNKIKGDYVEFGIYRGEMMYCAWRVLEKTGAVRNYIGLDTFHGEPEMTEAEKRVNPFAVPGDFAGSFEPTHRFLSTFLGEKLKLIQGDFREKDVISRCEDAENPIALAVIDCNLLSSIEASLTYAMPRMRPGGVLFVDDFFVNMHHGTCEVLAMLEREAERSKVRLVEFQAYPPAAKALIVTRET
jgi:hypothetical protein